MFANLDYPIADEGFRATVEAEARAGPRRAGRRARALPCSAATARSSSRWRCSGLEPALGRGELFGELLPRARAPRPAPTCPTCPRRPCGGALPVPARPRRRQLLRRRRLPAAAGATRAGRGALRLRVPGLRQRPGRGRGGGDPARGPRRRRRPPPALEGRGAARRRRRLGLRRRPRPLPARALRRRPGRAAPPRPRALPGLSRAVTGEAMAAVFGEWRRAGSPCGGGLVLWLRDLAPGAGWGLVDHSGAPKVRLPPPAPRARADCRSG